MRPGYLTLLHVFVCVFAFQSSASAQLTRVQVGFFLFDQVAARNEGALSDVLPLSSVQYPYTLTSASATGNEHSFAYLAAPILSNGESLPGGLGVCSTENGCRGNDEASVGRAGGSGNPESLTLNLQGYRGVDDNLNLIPRYAYLRDGQRGFDAFKGGDAKVLVNGQSFTIRDDGWLALRSLDDVPSLTFTYDNQEFFVQSLVVVPTPAALPLFASAIAGLGFFRCRRRST
jgi:hypothetical protein